MPGGLRGGLTWGPGSDHHLLRLTPQDIELRVAYIEQNPFGISNFTVLFLEVGKLQIRIIIT